MYDPHELLRTIDANLWPMVLVFAISMAFQAWWLVDSARVAKRDQAYSIPLFCTFFWFAHDLPGSPRNGVHPPGNRRLRL